MLSTWSGIDLLRDGFMQIYSLHSFELHLLLLEHVFLGRAAETAAIALVVASGRKTRLTSGESISASLASRQTLRQRSSTSMGTSAVSNFGFPVTTFGLMLANFAPPFAQSWSNVTDFRRHCGGRAEAEGLVQPPPLIV